ncbi:MAG: O-antigen ligase family protein [Candidatus Moraniibacteriota bacterium]
MIKEYFWIAVVGVLLNSGLIAADALGFLPMELPVFLFILFLILWFSWIRPIRMFWIFIILIPLERVILSSPQIPFSLRPYQLLGAALALALISRWIFEKFSLRQKMRLLKFDLKPLFSWRGKSGFLNLRDFLILLFPFIAIASIANAPNKASSIKLTLVLVSFIVIYWLTANFFLNKKRLQEALWFFVATSLPILIFGAYQAFAHKLGWPDFQIFAERSNGTFAEPDWFGVYLVFLASIIYWLNLQLFKTKNSTKIASWELRRVGKWFANFYLFFIFLVLLLTVARSAWLGFAGVTAVYFVLLWWQGKVFKFKKLTSKSLFKESFSLMLIYTFSIVVLLVFNLSQFHLINRAESSLSGMQKITISCEQDGQVPKKISSTEELSQYNCKHIRLEEISSEKNDGKLVKEVYRPDPNVEIRKNIYSKTWHSIKEHMIMGQGLGTSSEILGKDSHGQGLNSSNIFLEVWLSTGLIGLILFIGFFFLPIFLSLRRLFQKKKDNYGLSLFIVLSGAAFLIPNLFNAGIFLGIFWIWLAAIKE